MPVFSLGRLAPAPARARGHRVLTITASHAATLAPGAARRPEDATSLLQKALSSAAGFSVSARALGCTQSLVSVPSCDPAPGRVILCLYMAAICVLNGL